MDIFSNLLKKEKRPLWGCVWARVGPPEVKKASKWKEKISRELPMARSRCTTCIIRPTVSSLISCRGRLTFFLGLIRDLEGLEVRPSFLNRVAANLLGERLQLVGRIGEQRPEKPRALLFTNSTSFTWTKGDFLWAREEKIAWKWRTFFVLGMA